MKPHVFCILATLLFTSCQSPQPRSSWAGSYQKERIELMQMYPGISPEDAWAVYPDIDEMVVRSSWPSTLKLAVEWSIFSMSEEDRRAVRETKQKDLIRFQRGWGTEIRNRYGLWRGNTDLLADCHTEDPVVASMVIIEAVWLKLKES